MKWLFDNWKLFLLVLLALCELVLFILSLTKKAVKIDSLKEKILNLLPFIISIAEDLFGSGLGSVKKDYVLKVVKKVLSLDNSYDSFISEALENILSTPHKKEEKGIINEK